MKLDIFKPELQSEMDSNELRVVVGQELKDGDSSYCFNMKFPEDEIKKGVELSKLVGFVADEIIAWNDAMKIGDKGSGINGSKPINIAIQTKSLVLSTESSVMQAMTMKMKLGQTPKSKKAFAVRLWNVVSYMTRKRQVRTIYDVFADYDKQIELDQDVKEKTKLLAITPPNPVRILPGSNWALCNKDVKFSSNTK